MMEIKHNEVLCTIAEKKDLDSTIIETLKAVLKEFTDSFKASVSQAAAVAR